MATYYFSSSATNSLGAGTKSDPLPNLSSWTALRTFFRDGDWALFKRGDTFSGGMVSISGVSVNIGAYGAGAKPVFDAGMTSVEVVHADDLKIKDIHFKDTGGTSGHGIDIFGFSDNVSIDGCTFEGLNVGVFTGPLHASGLVTVERSSFNTVASGIIGDSDIRFAVNDTKFWNGGTDVTAEFGGEARFDLADVTSGVDADGADSPSSVFFQVRSNRSPHSVQRCRINKPDIGLDIAPDEGVRGEHEVQVFNNYFDTDSNPSELQQCMRVTNGYGADIRHNTFNMRKSAGASAQYGVNVPHLSGAVSAQYNQFNCESATNVQRNFYRTFLDGASLAGFQSISHNTYQNYTDSTAAYLVIGVGAVNLVTWKLGTTLDGRTADYSNFATVDFDDSDIRNAAPVINTNVLPIIDKQDDYDDDYFGVVREQPLTGGAVQKGTPPSTYVYYRKPNTVTFSGYSTKQQREDIVLNFDSIAGQDKRVSVVGGNITVDTPTVVSFHSGPRADMKVVYAEQLAANQRMNLDRFRNIASDRGDDLYISFGDTRVRVSGRIEVAVSDRMDRDNIEVID